MLSEAEAEAARDADRYGEMTRGYERMFPEFASSASPRLIIAVVASFYRGMLIEGFSSDRARLTQMATLFKAMLRNSWLAAGY